MVVGCGVYPEKRTLKESLMQRTTQCDFCLHRPLPLSPKLGHRLRKYRYLGIEGFRGWGVGGLGLRGLRWDLRPLFKAEYHSQA